ncbi:MAG: DUF3857 domain-containing protein [Bacteroidota bacterium]
MRRCLLHIFVILLLPDLVEAQEFSLEYGEISEAEYELERYHLDENAEAIIFYDIGESEVIAYFGSLVTLFTRTTRIKIMNSAGLSYAEVNIPLGQQPGITQMLVDIEGRTYNMVDGEEVVDTLDIEQCYPERVSKEMMILKVPLPGVKVGSIIEYKYSYITPYLFNLPGWYYQNLVPTVYSSYSINSNPNLEYKYLLKGYRDFDTVSTAYSEELRYMYNKPYFPFVSTYVMKDIPAFIEEEYISSSNDYIIRQSLQLSKVILPSGKEKDIQASWEELVSTMLVRKDFGKFIKESRRKFRVISKVNQFDHTGDEALFNSLTNYVKKGFTWDYVDALSTQQKAGDFFKKKTGNSCEVNLFLVGLLQAAGVEAVPVMISTRENGLVVDTHPFSHQFNHVIAAVKVNGEWVLTDATDPMCPNFSLPPRCINDKGLMVREGEAEWVDLQKMKPSRTDCRINIDLSGSEYHAEIETRAYHYNGYNNRIMIGNDTNAVRVNLRDRYLLAKDVSVSIRNQDSLTEPYILNYDFKCKTRVVGDRIFIHPFLAEAMDENPLKQQERGYPVDMGYIYKQNCRSNITIPDHYSIDHLPQPLRIETPSYDFDYSAFDNGGLIVVAMYVNLKKSIFSVEEYTLFKEFLSACVQKTREYIILKPDAESISDP